MGVFWREEKMVKPRGVADLAEDLQRAGIGAGDNLIVHSSLKSVGPVEDGPATVIDAILEVLGPTGNLMVPTFTYSMPMWSVEPFEIDTTPGRVGTIPEAVRHHPRAVRSFHPTHSVAVIGPEAHAITAGHIKATPIGEGSPFARMYERAAKILMLGTFQDTDSSLHYCEVASGVEYVHVPFTPGQNFELAWYIDAAGCVEYTEVREVPGCSRGFRSVEPPLRRAGILHDVRIGEAASQLLALEDLVPAVAHLLNECPSLMLCSIPNCAICPKRRRFLQSRGLA